MGLRRRRDLVLGAAFLTPALVLLGALVVYPIVATLGRSLGDEDGSFVGFANYSDMFTSDRTRSALRNTAIWVVFAPSLVTALGLIFAVLSERVRFATAFRVLVFMPMAISFLAAGVIFRLAYDKDPDRGLANAVVRVGAEAVSPPGPYAGARPSVEGRLRPAGDGWLTRQRFSPGEGAVVGLVGVRPADLRDGARPAADPSATSSRGDLAGVVWLDFSRGGGGRRGMVDADEVGLPGIRVEAVAAGGDTVGAATTRSDGSFRLTGTEPGGRYRLRLTEGAFRPPFRGVAWLGPSLATPAIIGAYVWIWAGFALVVIRAGLSALPRDVLEAASVDGASEVQALRHVTVPLLGPVLSVVAITLLINVLKVFDLVLVLAPGSVQADANVLALEMWRVSFGAAPDRGLGSALAVLLFVLVVPVMVLNLRRLRRLAAGGGGP